MDEYMLVDMMFDNEPIEKFEELLKSGVVGPEWGELLHLCYCEESYEDIGGDEGYLENPPIDNERLDYLKKLIALLESYGIKEIYESENEKHQNKQPFNEERVEYLRNLIDSLADNNIQENS
ncbi:MAG: hypothetical protein IJN27_05775 [Oscillospiraceae bacterium]|nr:hypothetical protein [Oscillospiraceae bacterium]